MWTRAEQRTIVHVTPEDLRTVHQSWSQLQPHTDQLLEELTRQFAGAKPSAFNAVARAHWLYEAVDELVELLAVPSELAEHARAIGETWPDPLTAPSFAVEGQAWLAAADTCLPAWNDQTACAWRHAWLLLSDVLAAEALSPFVDTLPSAQCAPATPTEGTEP